MKTHYTRKELRDLLRTSDRTITRKIKSGEFKHILRNGKQYFPKEQFEEVEQKDKTIVDNTFEMLKEQLEIKDRQIKELQEQLKEKEQNHHQQMIQQQTLQKGLQDRFLFLEQPKPTGSAGSKKKKKVQVKAKTKKETKKEVPKKEKGFWGKLFE